MKKNKGFTLIELLAVIVILGILLSISVVAVNKIRKNQEKENKENVISSILTGAKEYNADSKDNVNETVADCENNDDGTVKVSCLLKENYTDFDETKYPELLKDSNNDDITVSKTSCREDSIKYKYFITVDGKTYNDCGCESQADYRVNSTLTNGNKICKEN